MVRFVRCRATRGALRRSGRVVRKVLAAAAGPLLTAAGMALPPVAVTTAVAAGVTAAVAAGPAAPARAATGPAVAVVLVNGESSAPETAVLQAAGYTVTQVTPATLAGMSKTTFQGYAAVVIGDSSTSASCSTAKPSTSSLGSQWEGWVNGNVAVLGTAPAMPATSAANALIADAARYAAAQPASGSVTGLYLSLNCGYSTSAAGMAVSLLNGVDGIGTAGGVTVNGSLACADPGTVNKWEASAAATFGGFTSDSLGTGSWPSPACPVHEGFDSWPAMFMPVAYDAAPDATGNFTASDGATGQPYILLGAPISAGTQSLAPGTGGEVPLGATAGGANPAAPGVTQETAGDGVDSESGDFSRSATDFSVPAFGPALDFTRTYDAQQARQETVAGTPGPMGYGWTDNWATSLATARPAPGSVYTANGAATSDGNGSVPKSQPLGQASDVVVSGGNTYIAAEDTNRVEEIAASAGTQWGISMTAGDMYVVAGKNASNCGAGADGGVATASDLDDPGGVSLGVGSHAGDLYIADSASNRVQEVPVTSGTQWGQSMTAGHVYTVVGSPSGAQGTSASGGALGSSLLWNPAGVKIGGGDNLYIADTFNCRVVEAPWASGTQWGISMTAGDLYTVAGRNGAANCAVGNDGKPSTQSDLSNPTGVWVGNTNMYIADNINNRVQEVAGTAHTEFGQSMTAGDVYTVAGSPGGAFGFSGDGGAADSALADNAAGVWVDGAGNLYVADFFNNRVREVSASTDDIATIAGDGNDKQNEGDGAPAVQAGLFQPAGMASDADGDIFVVDAGNNRVQEMAASAHTQFGIAMTAGDVYTVAGSYWAQEGDSGDGGLATAALLAAPAALAIDANGDLLIADAQNNKVREDFSATPTLFKTAPAGKGITITQPDGSQVTCYPQTSGTCTAPYVAAAGSSYCTLPQDVTAVLTSTAGSYAYTPVPGITFTYNATTGALQTETDTAGDTLTITSNSPALGAGNCPASAASCQTITAASGRALVAGFNSAGLVTTVTDPMGRTRTYAYNPASQLTAATDPMGNVTSYTYGAGSTGNPQLASDMLTTTGPNAQPGGTDAGDATVNVYDSSGRVTSQTDPMGYKTTINYCVNAAAGDCMNTATGTGFITATDPDGDSTVYDYLQGTLAAQSTFTWAT